MVPPKRRPPDLDHCIQVLSRLQNLQLNQSPKLFGEIYVCGLGLLYHLKLDCKSIKEILTRHQGKASIPYPKANAIPAISAVIHNQNLFRALITCLSTSPAEMEVSDLVRAQNMAPGNRKRAASIDVSMGDVHPPSKTMKLSHSPHLSKRPTVFYGRPQMNVKLLAATILFVAFEHLDHWPAAFLRAYSEDCFGPRSWVDEAACRLFVENLGLAHAIVELDSSVATTIETKFYDDALVVSEFYEMSSHGAGRSSMNGTAASPTQRRGSLSSTASGGSNANRPIQRMRSLSTDSVGMTAPSSTPPTMVGSKVADYGEESDSGDEEEVVALTTSAPLSASHDDGASSSSGEAGEEVLMSVKSYSEDEIGRESLSPTPQVIEEPPQLKPSYPIEQRELSFARVRQRYFGRNLESAQRAIAESLQQRLDTKSKQNSGLLQTLPLFAGVPDVRRLITANLEKWLQSPALAGLARSLFSHTVSLFKNADPPLPADLESIDNILSMKLKANQLNAHVENIKSIAKTIPTAAVANHIYNQLLQQALIALGSADSSANDHLKMIHGVHRVFPDSMSAAAIAAALVGFLYERQGLRQELSQPAFVDRICRLLRAVAHDLGSAFNGLELLRSIAEFPIPDSVEWDEQSEFNRARVLFQCALLSIDIPADLQSNFVGKDISAENGSAVQLLSVRCTLTKVRKVLLKWFCNGFATFQRNSSDATYTRNGMVGAGVADYSSILDGVTVKALSDWENTLRALLFLEPPESPCLQQFLTSGDKVSADDTSVRVRLCFELGGDVDDELIRIVTNAAGRGEKNTPPAVALGVLEHLFHGCKKDRRASMSLKDPTLLWEFYRLVECSPSLQIRRETSSESGDGVMDSKELSMNGGIPTECISKSDNFPRLAYPGLWWRATCLALIMCGASPTTIGQMAWNEHPTLQTLIKMVTSDRYRFPTVDCDEAGREEMKKNEQKMRDEEARITESLFLPPRNSKPKDQESQTTKMTLGGSRASRRQQEKREGQLKKQREKEAQEALKEANRRRKLLRVAQKSIMLWDPKNGPRKPPKESADLIFSVGEHFDLQRRFQRATEPDFLLKTIGNTTRGAIERAYGWLIPIISVVPDTIVRLPASASCFLLLRAYGTEGEERAQLQELSTPLLAHVRGSLCGSFGEADAVRACDLLLGDLASHTADRRRCARRVLHDAIGNEVDEDLPKPFRKSNCSWMLKLLNLKHRDSILPGAIRLLSQAASFERGRVLRFLVLALDVLTEVATEKKLVGEFRFSTTLIRLISNRPTIFASTMGLFPDLRSLAIRLVDSEFRRHLSDPDADDMVLDTATDEVTELCDIVLCCGPTGDRGDGPITAKLPVALLESSCVLLSIWSEEDDGKAIESLVRMLMRMDEGVTDGEVGGEKGGNGLASASLSSTGQPAIPVESWVMLARSRSDFVAKRAALTAPTTFLPRLLLCSGLPKASLLSMIDRLGKLGDKGENIDKIYNKLLVPSAASEWDIGRLGKKKEVSRKLLGRLSAYARMYKLSELKGDESISTTFLEWLSGSNREIEKPRRYQSKEGKPTPPAMLANISGSSKILDAVTAEPIDKQDESETELQGDTADMTAFLMTHSSSATYAFSGTELEEIAVFFSEAIRNEHGHALEVWLRDNFDGPFERSKPGMGDDRPSLKGLSVACALLKLFSDLERKTESLGATLVKWVPVLSVYAGSPELWTYLLTEGQKPGFLWSNMISRCAQTWSRDHTSACRDWILSLEDFESLDLDKVVRFVVQSISWSNIHIEAFMDTSLQQKGNSWGFTEHSIRKGLNISIKALISGSEDDELLIQSTSRNNPPEAIVLLLLLSRLGRKHTQLVSQTLVESLNRDNDKARRVLLVAILRVYACFPHYMNLGVAALRSALKEAAEAFPFDWLSWRSPMDDTFEDLMTSLVQSGVPGLVVPALVDDAKKHPLLILRKLGRMEELLEKDAAALSVSLESEKRGVIFGRTLGDPACAKVEGNTLKVTMRYWGYNFTENLWISFLEIVTSVHNEVLFGCGFRMGLDKFLGVYLRLMSVQTQLRTSDRLSRLKGKLSDFFAVFKASNRDSWDEWLIREVDGLQSLGSARNVLLSCDFISHQEAVESVKRPQAQPSSSKVSYH